jgi:lysozyme
MNMSDEGLAMTKHFEGCRLEAYQDQSGIWTIGYGRTRGVLSGDECSPVVADCWLRTDIQFAADGVSNCLKVPLSQHAFDALVDFVFNLGRGALRGSTMLKKLNAGYYELAALEFPKWNKVRINGVLTVSPGLTRRRLAEQAMFLGKPWEELRGE